jgi:hypothetical protein
LFGLVQNLIRKILVLKNPFDLVGAQPEESLEEIRKKYKKLALLIHPDKCQLPKTADAFDSTRVALFGVLLLCMISCFHSFRTGQGDEEAGGRRPSRLVCKDSQEGSRRAREFDRNNERHDRAAKRCAHCVLVLCCAAALTSHTEAHRMELVNKALHQFETHVTTAEKYRQANAQWEKERKMEERERQKLQEEHEKLVCRIEIHYLSTTQRARDHALFRFCSGKRIETKESDRGAISSVASNQKVIPNIKQAVLRNQFRSAQDCRSCRSLKSRNESPISQLSKRNRRNELTSKHFIITLHNIHINRKRMFAKTHRLLYPLFCSIRVRLK